MSNPLSFSLSVSSRAITRAVTRATALAAVLLVAPACTLSQPAGDNGMTLATDEATLKRGRILFLQCQACHSLGDGEAHRVGPNLHGLFGRKAASQPGFGYSEAMQQSGIVWDAAQLNEFLTMPSAKVPGTIMAFAGVAKDSDRMALLSYLRSQTNP